MDTLTYLEHHDTLEDIAPPSAAITVDGHEASIERLRLSAQSGHHAIILEGEAGIGKATAAFVLAKHLLGAPMTEQTRFSVDQQSPVHRKVAQGGHANLLHLTRSWAPTTKKFKTVVTVDDVRRLQSFFGMTASGDSPRIVIVDTLQDMNRNAANALLKLLEEPPANCLFLLISQGLGRVLPTIRSRAQVVRFSPLPLHHVEAAIKRVAASSVNPSQTQTLASISGGSVRHALNMGLFGGVELLEAVNAVVTSAHYDARAAGKLADIAAGRGQDIQRDLLFDMLNEALRSHALHAARAGNTQSADGLAEAAMALGDRRRVANAYNLDMRQEFLLATQTVHSAIQTRGALTV
ncbi:MAG: DNA polymerase III subunit delta' [Pseudomonadota bacterium]